MKTLINSKPKSYLCDSLYTSYLIISDFPVGTFHTFVFYLADGIYLFILLLDKGKKIVHRK